MHLAARLSTNLFIMMHAEDLSVGLDGFVEPTASRTTRGAVMIPSQFTCHAAMRDSSTTPPSAFTAFVLDPSASTDRTTARRLSRIFVVKSSESSTRLIF